MQNISSQTNEQNGALVSAEELLLRRVKGATHNNHILSAVKSYMDQIKKIGQNEVIFPK